MKRTLIFALVATLFAACSTDPMQHLAAEFSETLTVSFDEECARVQLDGNSMVWTADDHISVFLRSDANQQWKFLGETGDTGGSLQCVDAGVAANTMNKVIALYPYSADYRINPQTLSVEAFMPAEQIYLADSFGVGSSILVSSGNDDHLAFKNVCGWLKLQFTGSGSVEKIVLRGNNGEQVAGGVTIDTSNASCTLASEINGSSVSVLTEVTLRCTTPVALDNTTPTTFYIALPPQTFAGGLTARAICEDGTQMTKITQNSVTITRNHIVPMSEVKYSATNVIYYTSSDGKVVTPRYARFGVNVISNTYENGIGKIVCDGDITEIGKEAFYQRTKLTTIIIPETVTAIGECAFQRCGFLENITIPNSVTTIGESAFQRCTALTKVTLSTRLTEIKYNTFGDCPALKTVTIPANVETIGERAFDSCDSLENLEICNGVKNIDLSAFANCSALTSVVIPDSVTEIGESAFYNCTKLAEITLGDGLKTIGNAVFYRCFALESIAIPDSVTTIGERSFNSCVKLGAFDGKFATADKRCLVIDGVLNSYAPAGQTEYTIPEGVTTIGTYSFADTYELVKIVIPKGVTLIDDRAFQNSNLKSVIIGPSVKKISAYAFYGCSALQEIEIPNSVTIIGQYAFFSCQSLSKVTIPNSVTTIGKSAFSSCTALTSVVIPDSITSIELGVFGGCSSLTDVTLPDSITSIGNSSFASCSALESFTIPVNVNFIGWKAFNYCTALTSVYCKPETPPTLESDVFRSTTADLKFYVPNSVDDSILNSYKTASGWSEYASAIEPYEFGN